MTHPELVSHVLPADAIGLILGTRNATPLECWVAVDNQRCVQLDDVVEIPIKHPETGETIRYYGLVEQVEKSLEGLSFDTDTRMVSEGTIPAQLSYVAKVTITRIEPEIFMPPQPGEPVYRATGANFDHALFFDGMEHRLPAGVLQSGQAAWINFDFVDGTNGGHVSISGISGVATKTSYTLFLLHGILRGNAIPRDKQQHSKAIIFNVKNEDLLFLDQPNRKLRPQDIKAYETLGLPAEPFRDVGFYAPCQSAQGEIMPSSQTRIQGVQAYGWDLVEIARGKLLRFLFTEDDRPGSNLGFVLDRVCNCLAEMADQRPQEERLAVLTTKDPYRKPLSSLQELSKHFQQIFEDAEEKEPMAEDAKRHWFGNNASGTILAFLRRLEASISHVAPFVRPDLRAENRIHWRQRKLSVVDINRLNSKAQMFVVGSLLQEIFEYKGSSGDKSPVFIVLDELNRYAPRSGWSPIKDMLLDIAERGRSMGLILLGAQQTASEVEKRVVANAAIRVSGRLDAAEAAAREYDFLRGAFRQRALMIRPGTMIVQQPELPSPLLVSYPFPAWATRATEVLYDDIEDDVFAAFDD